MDARPWYPKRHKYYVPADAWSEGDDIEQGDIFWGVPMLIAQHPDIADTFHEPLMPIPPAEDFDPPARSRVLDGVSVFAGSVMILPHTCDFYGPEKGRTNRARLVGRIERLAEAGFADPRLVRSGNGYNHTFFLPSWLNPGRDADDMLVNLRYMTTVDAAYLSRRRRVARLQNAAVIALRRRIAHFFTDYAPAPVELALADTVGGLIRGDRDVAPLHKRPDDAVSGP